jgi:hypothetical protein
LDARAEWLQPRKLERAGGDGAQVLPPLPASHP